MSGNQAAEIGYDSIRPYWEAWAFRALHEKSCLYTGTVRAPFPSFVGHPSLDLS